MSAADAVRLATCTACGCGDNAHAPTCGVRLGLSWSDARLRTFWLQAGGSFHGPNVETGTMPESKLLPLLRRMMRKAEGKS